MLNILHLKILHAPLHDTNDKRCSQCLQSPFYFLMRLCAMLLHSMETNPQDFQHAAASNNYRSDGEDSQVSGVYLYL